MTPPTPRVRRNDALVVLGATLIVALGVLYLRSSSSPLEPVYEDASPTFESVQSAPSTNGAVAPASGSALVWSKHDLGPFEATMPEPVRKDVTSIAATLEDATIVVIQLKRAEGPPMSLEERAVELAKAISVELIAPEQSTPSKRKVGTWDGIEVTTKGTLDGKRRVHSAWLCESGTSDAYAVVTTREDGKKVSEAGVVRFMASIRQTKPQEPAKK